MMAEESQLKDSTPSEAALDYGTVDHGDHGHDFKLHSFKTVTFCSVCDGMLWGFANQGYNCGLCDMSIHSRCLSKVTDSCKMAQVEEEAESPPNSPHNFHVHNFKTPSFCSHCGSFVFGFYNQGLKCGDCNKKVHHRCGVKIARRCDIAQH